MSNYSYLFIDRDGTLIKEPADNQVDDLSKLTLEKNVITALLKLQNADYRLVMVTNQDGLGTKSFPLENFNEVQDKLLELFESQGIKFESIKICPHFEEQKCACRKPQVGLLMDYLIEQAIDKKTSFVIGDRRTDLELAENLGINGIHYGKLDWDKICSMLLDTSRTATVKRTTAETAIEVTVNLDTTNQIDVSTGIGFFDHMLEQIARHAKMSLLVKAQGDLYVDEHHVVEDTALALGEAISKALGNKRGIERYGFILPMDESQAQIALDISGRPFCKFEAIFNREMVGNLPTELVSHFFQSFSNALKATLHISLTGENTHHMVEAAFKGLGKVLGIAIQRQGSSIPSTKGVL